MNIEEATIFVKDQLKWKLVTERGTGYSIGSNPFNRIHTIYSTKDLIGIQHEYAKLHELVHAYLGETICILLSTPVYNTPEEKVYFSKYEFAFNIAQDWFVDNYCIKLIGTENYIKSNSWIQTIKMCIPCLKITEDAEDSEKILFGSALAILAVNGIENISIPIRTINKVKRVLVKTTTEPSKENLEELINNLLKVFTDKQIVVREIDGVERIVIAK